MRTPSPTRALVAFHLQAGSRVSLRTFAPVAAGLSAAAVLIGDPLAVLAAVAAVLVPAEGTALSTALLAAVMLGVARATVPRLAHGCHGWVSHLPASTADRRRAHAVGIVAATGPSTALLAVAALTLPEPDPWRLVALPLLAWAAATAVGPDQRPVGRLLATAAAVAAAAGTGLGLAVATAAVAVAGRLTAPTRPTAAPAWAATAAAPPRRATAVRLELRWLGRAAGRQLVALAALAPLALVPAALFVLNNELAPAHRALALRLGAAIGTLAAVAAAGDVLRRRRPTWAWARSLPCSARRRVLLDATVLATVAVPTLAAAVVADFAATATVAAALPLLALRAAGTLRAGAREADAAAAGLLAEGGVVALLVALVPATALAALAATPFVLRLASAADRAAPASGFSELAADAASDHEGWAR